MIPGVKASAETTMEKVWFVAVVTFPEYLHSVPVHFALEQCAEILNAKYIAVTDQNYPFCAGTEKWLRVLQNSRNPHLHQLTELIKQREYYLACGELKTQLRAFCELLIRIRSLLKEINNNASRIIIYLDYAHPLQLIAVWLSVVSLVVTRNRTIVWTHLHRMVYWQETKLEQFVRCLFNILPIKTLQTTYTNEIAKNRRYGWVVDILPLPLNPALDSFAYKNNSTNETTDFHEKYDKLVCWLVLRRSEQGLELLPRMIDHKSTRKFPKKFIKCFVSDDADIKENAEIELVRLGYSSSEDYYSHFNECEVVLLPYDAHAYNGGMSMVFIEAIASSKITIVSDGTVMASELRRFKLGDLVLDFNNGFSWTLINEIREDIGIRARLNLMAESYAKEHDTFGCAQSLYKSLKRIDSQLTLAEPKRA
jgi:hypothetical protein